MARVEIYPWKWTTDYKTKVGWGIAMTEEHAELDRLQAISDALPIGGIVGGILYFPRGDGNAVYIVTKEKPLTIAWIECGDAWDIEAYATRGLQLNDVIARLSWRRVMLDDRNKNINKEGECTTTT